MGRIGIGMKIKNTKKEIEDFLYSFDLDAGNPLYLGKDKDWMSNRLFRLTGEKDLRAYASSLYIFIVYFPTDINITIDDLDRAAGIFKNKLNHMAHPVKSKKDLLVVSK